MENLITLFPEDKEKREHLERLLNDYKEFTNDEYGRTEIDKMFNIYILVDIITDPDYRQIESIDINAFDTELDFLSYCFNFLVERDYYTIYYDEDDGEKEEKILNSLFDELVNNKIGR